MNAPEILDPKTQTITEILALIDKLYQILDPLNTTYASDLEGEIAIGKIYADFVESHKIEIGKLKIQLQFVDKQQLITAITTHKNSDPCFMLLGHKLIATEFVNQVNKTPSWLQRFEGRVKSTLDGLAVTE